MKYYNPTLKEKPILLIDGDLFLYQAASVSEYETDWGDDIFSLSTDLKMAKKIFSNFLDTTKERLKTDEMIICLTGSDNFRREIEPSYKSGRKKTRKPVGYAAFVDWCKDTYRCHQEPLLEADDIMGILGSYPDSKGIIVSNDKDMKGVPCKLYRPMSDELLEITTAQADRFFYTQALCGDPTDGYYGVKGVGAKTAEKILGTRPDWSLVEQTYVKNGYSKQDAITQARLARILRYTEWDEEKSIIKLWEPFKR